MKRGRERKKLERMLRKWRIKGAHTKHFTVHFSMVLQECTGRRGVGNRTGGATLNPYVAGLFACGDGE